MKTTTISKTKHTVPATEAPRCECGNRADFFHAPTKTYACKDSLDLYADCGMKTWRRVVAR